MILSSHEVTRKVSSQFSTKAFLKSTFDIKDLGELKYFLRIQISRSKEGLFLSQRNYTLDLLNET